MESLGDLLRSSAQRFGPTTALLFKPGIRTQRWSYQDLWESSGRMAGYLASQGIGKGDPVLFWAPNMPEWVVAFFACMRRGAVAVPIDLRSSPDFVARVEEQTQPRLRFVSRFTPPRPQRDVPEVDLLDLRRLLLNAEDGPEESPGPEDLAEVMFTSGTTGDPKGVMLTHGNILSNVISVGQVFPSDPSIRLLSLLPLSHMFEQTIGLLSALNGGASIVYPSSRQPAVLFRTLRDYRVTTLALVPQALQLLWNAIEREVARAGRERQFQAMLRLAERLPFPARRWLFSSLHGRLGGRLWLAISGGAYLDPELARKWESLGVRILQGYGATEASPALTGTGLADRNLASVGRALPGVEVRIAQDGEIIAKGPNITQGYWHNPATTAAAFQEGWYRTGDLGYLDPQGYLYLKGRKKDMIVLASGQNVYPEDLETLLRKEPGVRDAAVVGLPGKGSEGTRVHAALLMEAGTESQAPAVVQAVNGQVAEHQAIQGFTLWPESDFPRTHTLKVKKNLVLDFLTQSHEPEKQPLAPAPLPPEPSLLLRILSQVAPNPPYPIATQSRLGPDLGLDSLGRVELLSAIEAEMGTYIDETQVGPDTTVADLERMASERRAAPPITFWRWPLTPWCRLLRDFLQTTLVFPFLSLLYRLKVSGDENLTVLAMPVIFACNHSVEWDVGLIPRAIPRPWRGRMAIVAAAEAVFHQRWRGILSALLGNAFPFYRKEALRPSLEYMGQLLDDGWNVLIFPEGQLTVGGPIQPFQPGTGLVATEAGATLVPMGLTLTRPGWSQGGPAFSRTGVEIRIGKPIVLPSGMPFLEATETLEQAVRSLAPAYDTQVRVLAPQVGGTRRMEGPGGASE